MRPGGSRGRFLARASAPLAPFASQHVGVPIAEAATFEEAPTTRAVKVSGPCGTLDASSYLGAKRYTRSQFAVQFGKCTRCSLFAFSYPSAGASPCHA